MNVHIRIYVYFHKIDVDILQWVIKKKINCHKIFNTPQVNYINIFRRVTISIIKNICNNIVQIKIISFMPIYKTNKIYLLIFSFYST